MIQHISRVSAVGDEIERIAKLRVFAAAQHYRSSMLETLGGARSGREYRVRGTRRTYTASAPGEAPASMLGDLRRSVRVSQPETTLDGVRCAVGSDLDKALMLEKGTSRMAARPAWEPTMRREAGNIAAILEARWD